MALCMHVATRNMIIWYKSRNNRCWSEGDDAEPRWSSWAWTMENGGKEIGFLAIPSWQESNLRVCRKSTDDLAPLRGWGAKGATKRCTCTSITSIVSLLLNIHSDHKTPTFLVALLIHSPSVDDKFYLRTGQLPKKPRYTYLHRGIVKYFCNQHRAFIILLYTVFTTNLRC